VQNSVKEISKILRLFNVHAYCNFLLCLSIFTFFVTFSTITDIVKVSVTSTSVIVTCTKYGIFDIIALASDFSHVEACGF